MTAADLADLATIDKALEEETLGLALAGCGLITGKPESFADAGLAWTTGDALRGYVLARCGLGALVLRETAPERLVRAARHLCALLGENGGAA